MHCPHCGNRISDTLAKGLEKCPSCGRALSQASAGGGPSAGAGTPAPRRPASSITRRFEADEGPREPHAIPGGQVLVGKSRDEPIGVTPRSKTPLLRETPRRIPEAPQPPKALDVPKKLGTYEVRGKLGEGGMGVVLDGYDPQLDRRVAIKLLSPELAKNAQFVRRFLSEARAVARISHPNVAIVYFAGSEGDRHFFVMEFVKGESLDERIERDGPLSPKRALGYVMQAVRGLAAAAEKGIIHRDVKPANLMVNEEDEVKVTDFGLAKFVGGDAKLTQAGSVLGSPHFMSPEQGRGEETDLRADLYALGASLHYLLTRRTPYEGSTPLAVIHQHQEGPVPQINRATPSLNRLLGRMMAKDKNERYQSYKELMTDLIRLDRGGLLRDKVIDETGSTAPVAPARPGARPSPAGTPRLSDIPTQVTPVMTPAAGPDVMSRIEAVMKGAAKAGLEPAAAARPAPAEPKEEEAPEERRAKKIFLAACAALVVLVLLLRPWGWFPGGEEKVPVSPGESRMIMKGIAQLRPALGNPSPDVRRAAVAGLARFPGPSAEMFLRQALADRDSAVRAEAARSLAKLGRPGPVVALAKRLLDKEPEVRLAAAEAVSKLTGYDLSRTEWPTAPYGVRRAATEEFLSWWSTRGP